ncbi:NUDIX hydrolase [Bordetella hinzii]|uniref:NUDIX hydrolase n=1 Tax=Bordetella hinzii TaxID=103855 RepID=UPI002A18CBFF|nr:NUDIX hydrolase [Bordetella hinzii]WPL79508.1 NUDIX hydrolase [Bordetella hinzii]
MSKKAYGGVIFDSNGLVLLREPKSHFDGYVWTFPKGRTDPGETAEQTALREVKEETGVDATIVSLLPGEYLGGTSVTRYFQMTAEVGAGGVAPDDKETASVKWMTPAEARQHIMQTTNTTGRKRDLTVLDAALAIRET